MKFVELKVHQAVHVIEAQGAAVKFGVGADKAILQKAIIQKVDGGFTVKFKEGSGYFISDNNVVWARYAEETPIGKALGDDLKTHLENIKTELTTPPSEEAQSKSQKRRLKVQKSDAIDAE